MPVGVPLPDPAPLNYFTQGLKTLQQKHTRTPSPLSQSAVGARKFTVTANQPPRLPAPPTERFRLYETRYLIVFDCAQEVHRMVASSARACWSRLAQLDASLTCQHATSTSASTSASASASTCALIAIATITTAVGTASTSTGRSVEKLLMAEG